MLTVQPILNNTAIMVIPVVNRRECPDSEFVFDTEEQAKAWIDYYFHNPCAAIFAYNVQHP